MDRRTSFRCPIRLAVEYKIVGSKNTITGTGLTMDLSSGGVSFLCGEVLPLGYGATLSIAWPVTLNDGVALRFHVEGKVVRVEEHLSVVNIQRYVFRTTRQS